MYTLTTGRAHTRAPACKWGEMASGRRMERMEGAWHARRVGVGPRLEAPALRTMARPERARELRPMARSPREGVAAAAEVVAAAPAAGAVTAAAMLVVPELAAGRLWRAARARLHALPAQRVG